MKRHANVEWSLSESGAAHGNERRLSQALGYLRSLHSSLKYVDITLWRLCPMSPQAATVHESQM